MLPLTWRIMSSVRCAVAIEASSVAVFIPCGLNSQSADPKSAAPVGSERARRRRYSSDADNAASARFVSPYPSGCVPNNAASAANVSETTGR